MSALPHPARQSGDADLLVSATAEPTAAGQLSGEVRAWLTRRVRIDSGRIADIVLATYEALANCADHAYRGESATGVMSVEARHDTDARTVRLCVVDRGHWLDPCSKPENPARGRGLTLMRALCDDLTVDGTDSGTRVCLQFERCPAR
ncbi:MAG: ATP-binding protein [Mycolicibacterium neoaurum]|uniref:ATP-binding protein n=1 Tax=Mycolicibacterium neoaurum TaxID=1795 RepID=UPI002FFB32E8